MRGTPTYDLQHLQQLVGQGPLTRTITTVATEGASAAGFFIEHMVEAVLLLRPSDFYKTMESERVPGSWQDVYHLEYGGTQLYIKLQLGLDGRAFLIQFKQK